MNIEWNEEKNEKLKIDRDISFDEVAVKIMSGQTLMNAPHNNSRKYPNQHIYVVDIENYCYMVLYVKDGKNIFLKTIIPSRKMTKKLLGESNGKK